jgi:hypothetical protein
LTVSRVRAAGAGNTKRKRDMGLHIELQVYKASYDLLIVIFQFTKEFAKEYKYTIGEIMKKEALDLLLLIYRANSRKDRTEILQTAREKIEAVRLLVRVMKDLRQISLKKFIFINEHIETVSKQLTAWQKSS